METLDRRSALALGAAVLAPLVISSRPAAAAMYAADAGKEIMPGVREIALGEWPIMLSAYKKAVVADYVVAPGSGFPNEKMPNDMICQILEGEFLVKQDDNEYMAKTGHTFACATGSTEEDKNQGSVAAVMRVINLFPA